MPATPHSERHFTATETVREVVIGSDIYSGVYYWIVSFGFIQLFVSILCVVGDLL